MSFNLLRNSRVFFTTAVGTSGSGLGVIAAAGAPSITASNTREIQVLDGFGFSQNTTSETVTLNETGASPVRGQRSFNTQLDPVDFNMTTYIRPFKDTTGGSVTSFTWGTTTGAITAGSSASTTLLTSYPSNIITASAATQAFATDFGLNTFIYATSAPSGGVTATFAPIFGVDSSTPNYQKLIGIYLLDGGSGYTVPPTVTIVDPDSGAEPVSLPTISTVISSAGTASYTAEESVLWNALFTDGAIGSGTKAWTNTTSAPATCTATYSNKHQLQRFGLIVIIDTACFLIDDCVLNTATIDFGIDAIASIQWAGQAKAIRQIASPTFATNTTWSGSLTGDFKPKITTAAFIANKLSVVTLQQNLTGTGSSTNPYYNVPLTGGNLTISNNISYLTPANLGIVNQPVTYFAGTRAISGSLTAYLRTGAASPNTQTGSSNLVNTTPTSSDAKTTAQLLSDLLTASSTDVDPAYRLKISIGGTSATDRVELNMPGVVLTIPTIATEQVISTTINFTAQGVTSNNFDLAAVNELDVAYYS